MADDNVDNDTGPSEAEVKAMAGGWRPLEEWNGDPDAFVTAEVFNERGEQILPIVKKQNAELKEQVNALTGEIETIKQTAAQFREFQKAEVKKQKDFYDKQIADLKDLKKQAINDSDGEQVTLIEDQIDAAKEAKNAVRVEEPPPSQAVMSDAEAAKLAEEWGQENTWYTTNAELKEEADLYAAGLATTTTLKGRELLDKVSEKIKKSFPQHFKNANRDRESLGEGGPTTNGKGGKTFADIPAADKKAYAQFKELMPEFTKEEYAAGYFAGEE